MKLILLAIIAAACIQSCSHVADIKLGIKIMNFHAPKTLTPAPGVNKQQRYLETAGRPFT